MTGIKLTNANFKSEVTESDRPVLIDFFATWCGPCKMLSPVIEEIANEYGDKIKVAKVDVDEEPELASAFEIESIPTVIIMKNGKPTNKIIGLRTKNDIIKLIDL